MASARIIITGRAESKPKIGRDESVEISFRIPMSPSVPKGLSSLGESLYIVNVSPKAWKRVSGQVNINSIFIIQGEPKAAITDHNDPFIRVIAFDVKIKGESSDVFSVPEINLVDVKEKVEQNGDMNEVKIVNMYPENTDECVEISDIKIPQGHKGPLLKDKRLTIALESIISNKGFIKPFKVSKKTMMLMDNYYLYWASMYLKLQKIPVNYYKAERSEYKDFDDYISKHFSSDEIVMINPNDIILEEEVHLKGIPIFLRNVEYYKSNPMKRPLIIRPLDNGRYALVMGIIRYAIARLLNIGEVPAIIKNIYHYELVQAMGIHDKNYDRIKTPNGTQTLISIENITIPKEFLKHYVRKEKLNQEIKYFKEYGYLSEPVKVNNDNVLVDGYSRYIVAGKLGLKKVPVKIQDDKCD